jgi:hypothetical protein
LSQALVAHVYNPTWEAEIGRISFEASLANSLQDPISKITRAKWFEDGAFLKYFVTVTKSD